MDDFKQILRENKFKFECFGSCFNTYKRNKYCSLYYDNFEKYFGS